MNQSLKDNEIAVKIPGSKSITHRALICGSLADGTSTLKGYLLCDDTSFTMDCMKMFSSGIDLLDNKLIFYGRKDKFPESKGINHVYFGDSGTSMRLLLSVLALTKGDYIVTGSKRMKHRPVGELISALSDMGVDVWCMEKDGFPPVFLKACGIRGGRVRINGEHSSQYISSILISSPYAERDVEIELAQEPVSRPYIDITIDVMNQFGVNVIRDGYGYFRVNSGSSYIARDFQVEGDVSSASYFWGASAISGIKVTTLNIFPFKTKQGDIRFLDVLEEMGCRVIREEDRVSVMRGDELKGIEVDMGDMPDMVPTLSVVSLFSRGKTVIRNVRHLIYKESNRLSTLAGNIRNMGGEAELTQDGIIVHGGRRLHPALISPQNDHRIAMSFAMASLKVPGIKILNKDCVHKSFPDFWTLWHNTFPGSSKN